MASPLLQVAENQGRDHPPKERRASGPESSDGRQQAWFILLFFVGSLSLTVSNSLESVYIGHIRACADSPALPCQPPFLNAAAAASNNSCLPHHNVSCAALMAQLSGGCEAAVPVWAALPDSVKQSRFMHIPVSHRGPVHVREVCRRSCGVCVDSSATNDATAQLAAYAMVETFLSWSGYLSGFWGGLTAKVARCIGEGDSNHMIAQLIRMALLSACIASAVSWAVIYPFGRSLVVVAFEPKADVLSYAIPFMDVHAAGVLFGFVQSVLEATIQGLQFVQVQCAITLLRSCYMGVVNYFTILVWDGFGISGVFGEGIASTSRHAVVLTAAAAFLFGYKDHRRTGRVAFWRAAARPSAATWRSFLKDGVVLLINGYLASVSKFVSPMATSRLQAGKLSLDARVIIDNVAAYPAIIGGVITSTVIVLGSKYTGQATRTSIDTYMIFVRRLFLFTLVAAGTVGGALFLYADSVFGLFTTSSATISLCEGVRELVLAKVVLNIMGSVVGGMVYAAQEFELLTAINIVSQFAVYLPAMLLAEKGYFSGHGGGSHETVGLYGLMVPDLLQSLAVAVCQLVLVCTRVRWGLRRAIVADDVAAVRSLTVEAAAVGQIGSINSGTTFEYF